MAKAMDVCAHFEPPRTPVTTLPSCKRGDVRLHKEASGPNPAIMLDIYALLFSSGGLALFEYLASLSLDDIICDSEYSSATLESLMPLAKVVASEDQALHVCLTRSAPLPYIILPAEGIRLRGASIRLSRRLPPHVVRQHVNHMLIRRRV